MVTTCAVMGTTAWENIYAYVGGNPLSLIDPSGEIGLAGGVFLGLPLVGIAIAVQSQQSGPNSSSGGSGKEDILTPGQIVNNAAQKEYGNTCPSDSNCVWAKAPDLNPRYVPAGWILCHYRCKTSNSQVLSRYMPIELGCPQPVAVAPGLYPGNGPPPPRGAGTPMPFDKIPFRGFMP